ncbi:MAG: poly-beta-1,6-N-acetyl-D-glucosamine N-deacetylase PgaB [Gammaproteobacteria bacterium]
MKQQLRIFALTLLLILSGNATAAGGSFIALCYHDIQDDPQHQRVADALTISSAELVAQFNWLREHGYRPVSLDDILAARDGRRPLPEKAVLLTFDDGYLSTYTRVFPLLKLFDYPAVVAPLAKWIESKESQLQYGDKTAPRTAFLSWQQLREMADSGLVEIASHSYDLHHGVPGNPQGNRQPAATTRIYDAHRQRYEADEAFQHRIRQDLRRSRDLIEQRTGHRPRIVVWPYGSYSQEVVDIATELDMPVTFTLDEGTNDIHRLQAVKRILLPDATRLEDLAAELTLPTQPPFVRVAHVDLDYVYDQDPRQQEANLGRLLDRIKALQINTVYLQAYADPDGDGTADALYFPNRHLPMRADLFNRVAWQLLTRSEVQVYAWLPVLAFQLPPEHPAAQLLVERASAPDSGRDAVDYRRLSPFSREAHEVVKQIYEDLAKHAHFQGLLFHDDAYLSDYEDASPLALQVYQEQWGLPASLAAIRQDPALLNEWTRRKTDTLIYWTQTLADQVRYYRPEIKTARNLYAATVLNPAAQSWFAQSLRTFLTAYDYTALMAMPYMEGARQPKHWLRQLATRIHAVPGAVPRVVFELQSRNWHRDQPVADETLRTQMHLLQTLGIRNYGYYPDDFIHERPDIGAIRPLMSLSDYPYPRP